AARPARPASPSTTAFPAPAVRPAVALQFASPTGERAVSICARATAGPNSAAAATIPAQPSHVPSALIAFLHRARTRLLSKLGLPRAAGKGRRGVATPFVA